MNKTQIPLMTMKRLIPMTLLAMVGCQLVPPTTGIVSRDDERKLEEITKRLDVIEPFAREWGTVGMSELVFEQNKHQFKIDFDIPVTTYINDAKTSVQVGAGHFLGTSFGASLGLSAQFGAPISLGAAPQTNATVPSANAPALTTSMPSNSYSFGSFAQLPPSVSSRQAVSIGFNDKVAEMLLKLLTDPRQLPSDKVLLFGVMQVSCRPGTRTQKGYVGNVDVVLEYAKKAGAQSATNAATPSHGRTATEQAIGSVGPTQSSAAAAAAAPKGLAPSDVVAGDSGTATDKKAWNPDPGKPSEYELRSDGYRPSIYAVLPLVDAETQDLRNASRHQIELALRLAASFAAQGLGASADLMLKYARQRQDELNTRSVRPLVTSYTDSKGFGFAIRPATRALESPGRGEVDRAEVLSHDPFPALVAIIVNRAEYIGKGTPGKAEWTNYALTVSTSWSPEDGGKTLANKQRQNIAAHFDHVAFGLRELSNTTKNTTQYRQLSARAKVMDSIAFDTLKFAALPPLFPKATAPTVPKISRVAPLLVSRAAGSTIVVEGSDFENNVQRMTLGGIECRFAIVSDTLLTLEVPAQFPLFGQQAVAAIGAGGHSTSTEQINFGPQPPTTDLPTLTVTRDASGKFTKIELKSSKTTSEADLLKAAQEVLSKSEAPPSGKPEK